MRILFLHEVSYKSKPIFEMHEFPEHLASRGHEVYFIDYLEDRVGSGFSVFREEIQGRVLTDVRISLTTLAPNISGTMGRLITALFFPLFFLTELRRVKPDVIVCYAVPTLGWQAVLVSRFARVPFVFRALDVSHRIRKTLAWPAVFLAEVVTYSFANFVTANNAALLEYCQKMGARRSQSSVVLPPLDHENFSNVNHPNAAQRQVNLVRKTYVVTYMGSFFYFSGLKQVIESLSSLPPEAKLWLIGGGEQEKMLRATLARTGCEDHVDFKGFVDYQSLGDFFANSDVAINPMDRTLVSNLALPNKVLQYMSASLPVVSTRLKGLEKTLGGAPGLFLVDQPEQVIDKVSEILLRPDLDDLGDQNAEFIRRMFSLEESVLAFEGVIIAAR